MLSNKSFTKPPEGLGARDGGVTEEGTRKDVEHLQIPPQSALASE